MTEPLIISGDDINLSQAWLRTMKHIVSHSGKEITPLLLTLTNFNEEGKIRNGLDIHLKSKGFGSVATVSETIFPQSLYLFCDEDRNVLYREYLETNLPRIKKIDSRNSNGTYFERLIAYDNGGKKINQLEMIIESLQKKNVKRRSKLQASIFDPTKDHKTGAFQGFPCLQHVTFFESNGELVLNSFYAVQYIYTRAYGNWLGLINLGRFIGKELGIEFKRFNCFIGVEQLEDKIKKGQADKLVKSIS